MRNRRLPLWLTIPMAVGGFLAMAWLERRRPLRPATEPKLKRELRNLAVAGVGAMAIQLGEMPVAYSLLLPLVERQKWGLLQQWRLPLWIEITLAFLIMDYSMYVWHILMHRVPLLWRFHLAHHTDLDLDASTALRFHFGELLWSLPWRAAQIVVIGVTPRTLALYQRLLMLSVMFHHSNVRISTRTEKWLSRIIMTPRLHGIHHSVEHDDVNSNWSSGLTIWDTIHHTLRAHVTGDEVTIGLADYRDPDELTLPDVLTMPFAQSTAKRVKQRLVKRNS